MFQLIEAPGWQSVVRTRERDQPAVISWSLVTGDEAYVARTRAAPHVPRGGYDQLIRRVRASA